MFYIIENEEQLNKLQNLGNVFLNIIPNNNNYHPKLSDISLIYIKPLNKNKSYIICINHNESNSLLNLNLIDLWLNSNTNNIFVIDKKKHLYFIQNSHYKLINLNTDKKLENICISIFYQKHNDFKNINNVIPISKHYEYNENLYKSVKNKIKDYNNDYNDKNIYCFFNIENKGIKLNKNKFKKHYYHIQSPKFSINNGKIYTNYNLNTLTKRPSNSFNEINFSALNKHNDERECFIPYNDIFIEFDISSYHPRLIADIIKFKFPSDEVYEFLKMEKQEVFQNIYGFIKKENLDKPFFKELKNYLTNNNINNKELSYLIQEKETTTNIDFIWDINDFLKNKKSDLILYTYDAFLLDVKYEELEEIIYVVKNIIKYPTKIKIGNNYNNMKKYG